jgi:DNA-binding Lrp family transcriptional regulator
MDKLISLLEENARLTNEQLAVMLGTTTEDVAKKIKQYEEDGILIGYTAIVDKETLDKDYVEAFIELRVTPKPDFGFDEIAQRVAQYDEVKSVYLMSGGYDLAVIVSGRDFKDIALFVAKRLSVLDSVVSTATHFLLKRYKEHGTLLGMKEKDERSV